MTEVVDTNQPFSCSFEHGEQCQECKHEFTQTKHRKFACEFCDESMCTQCLSDKILTACTPISCKKCKNIFCQVALFKYFDKDFMGYEFRRYRTKVIYTYSKASLSAGRAGAQVQALWKAKQNSLKKDERETQKIREEKYTIKFKMIDLERQLFNKRRIINNSGPPRETSENEDILKKPSEFITRGICPMDNCRGFIGKGWACDVCQTKVCSTCMVAVAEKEVGKSPHTCNPEDVASVELIRKDSKPCPRCRVRIYRTYGCRQIWCVNCRTAFDYHTLKEISTKRGFENPHYTEYLNSRRAEEGIRLVEQTQIHCTNESVVRRFRNWLLHIPRANSLSYEEKMKFRPIRQLIDFVLTIINGTHFSFPDEDEYQHKIKTIQAEFLLNKLTEESFGTKLQRLEKVHMFHTEKAQIGHTLAQVVSDICHNLVNDPKGRSLLDPDYFKLINQQFDRVKNFTDDSLRKTHGFFGVTYDPRQELGIN